jgi:hypothetical protein
MGWKQRVEVKTIEDKTVLDASLLLISDVVTAGGRR